MARKGGRLARQRLDPHRIERARRDDPAAADAEHRIQRKPFGCGRGADPAGRTEIDPAERARERLQRRDPAARRRGKEFEAVQAKVEPRHDVRRVGHAGQEGNARSEEHTSELQSLMRISYAVFCLKKTKHDTRKTTAMRSTTTRT